MLSLAILIPLLGEALGEKEDLARARGLLNSLFTATFFLVATISVFAYVFAPELTRLFFPGLANGPDAKTLIFLTRLLLISPFFFSLSGILASVVQLYNRFYITSLSPILYNVGIIIGITYLYPMLGVVGLGIGVLAGAFLHMAVQVPFVLRQKLFPKFTWHILWDDLKQVGKLSIYRGIGLGSQQVVLIVLLGLATTIGIGSVSIMTFAQNLQGIPLTLIGAAYAVATFPVLTRFFTTGDKEAFIDQLKNATRHIIFWSLPVISLFVVLRAQIVRVILGSGSFDWGDTKLTAACLALFVISVVFQGLSMLFVRAYYAACRNKEAAYIGVFSSVCTAVLAYYGVRLFEYAPQFRYFMEHLLRVEDVNGTGVLILPLAFSIGAIINTFLFVVFLRRDFNFKFNVLGTAFHSFAASVAMALVSYEFLDYFGTIFNLNTFKGVFLQGFFAGILGIIAGIFLLYILKNREFFETIGALKKRFTKEEIIGPQEV
jgi:putative peptidoglycan lipid II flippase